MSEARVRSASTSSWTRKSACPSARRHRAAAAVALAALAFSCPTLRTQESAPAASRGSGPGIEARWVEYKESATSPEAKQSFVQRLVKDGDHELLEWLAIYDGVAAAAQALRGTQSSRWPRCTAWLANHPDSHTRDAVTKNIPKERTGQLLAWLRKHPESVWGNTQNLMVGLEQSSGKGGDAGEAGDALPPHDPAAVLALLQPPQELATWGDRAPATDAVYVHQVLRAIDALIASGLREEPWIGRLVSLTRHRNEVVRRAAHLAFTRLPPPLIPLVQFLATVTGPGPEEDRRAALMAVSFSEHPRVFVLLHDIAADPKHACWRTAVDRLGDLGNGFTLLHLEEQNPPRVAGEDQELLERRFALIRQRLAAEGDAHAAASVRPLLERAAWAERSGDPLGKALVAWTLDRLKGFDHKGILGQVIAAMRDTYVAPAVLEGEARAVQDRVRSLAREALQ